MLTPPNSRPASPLLGASRLDLSSSAISKELFSSGSFSTVPHPSTTLLPDGSHNVLSLSPLHLNSTPRLLFDTIQLENIALDVGIGAVERGVPGFNIRTFQEDMVREHCFLSVTTDPALVHRLISASLAQHVKHLQNPSSKCTPSDLLELGDSSSTNLLNTNLLNTVATSVDPMLPSFTAIGQAMLQDSIPSPTLALLLAHQEKNVPKLINSDAESILSFLRSWTAYRSNASGILTLKSLISPDVVLDLELIHMPKLPSGRLPYDNDQLESFLRSILPVSTYDDILYYFRTHVKMAYAPHNGFTAHKVEVYLAYYNKFMRAYQLFRQFFDRERNKNADRHMKIIFNLFAMGIEPLRSRQFILDAYSFRDFSELNERFQQLIQKIKQAHADAHPPSGGPPKGHNPQAAGKRDQTRPSSVDPRDPTRSAAAGAGPSSPDNRPVPNVLIIPRLPLSAGLRDPRILAVPLLRPLRLVLTLSRTCPLLRYVHRLTQHFSLLIIIILLLLIPFWILEVL